MTAKGWKSPAFPPSPDFRQEMPSSPVGDTATGARKQLGVGYGA